MDRSDSSFPFEEPFEDRDQFGGGQGSAEGRDPVEAISEGPIDDLAMDADGLPLRGWIPRDDRLWLHPSEIGRDSRMQHAGETRRRARRPDRRGLLATGIVASAALTAAVAAVALAASSANPVATSPPKAKHLTSSITLSTASQAINESSISKCPSGWMSAPICTAVKNIEPSMLRIVVRHGASTADGTAVVVPFESATVAITAASLVGNAQTVETFDPSGQPRTVNVLGVDKSTGIAVVHVPWKMKAASIAQKALSPGEEIVLASLSRSDALVPVMGEVKTQIPEDSLLMDAIEVDISPVATPGGVIIDSTGDVLGILDATQKSATNLTGQFVPSWLAVGVADQLATTHRIVHGWLDVEGQNDLYGGAMVVAVPANGPAAAAGLKPGDIVVAISTATGTVQIQSMADLRGRLYLEPPGARIEIEVIRDGQDLFMSSVLSASR